MPPKFFEGLSNEDFDNIVRIANLFEARLDELHVSHLRRTSRVTLLMDITACHQNGCPLKLAAMADGSTSDIIHDVAGIQRHINRETGQLEDCFLPRYAAPTA